MSPCERVRRALVGRLRHAARNPSLKEGSIIEPAPVFDDLTQFHLAREIARWGWSIGAHSYGCPRILEPELARLTIGRFCSIAPNVTIVLGNHRTDLVATYPFHAIAHLSGGKLWPSAHGVGNDHATRGDVIIGDEVWLGTNSTILSGVTIGTGAVVGAGSVIRRDVPPYAIVSGDPATVVRHRFDAGTVQRLLATNWWSWPDERIAANMHLIVSSDIETFLAHAEAEKAVPAPKRG